MLHKRTKKEFKDYNVYHDRPFGLKWGTAYAMDELVKVIKTNEDIALRYNPTLEAMDQEEIDTILSESYLYHKEVEIQLNLKDEYGRLLDNISGYFYGESYEDYFVIDGQPILWEDVRHISIKTFKKWFDVDLFGNQEQKLKASDTSAEIKMVKDEFYQPFADEI